MLDRWRDWTAQNLNPELALGLVSLIATLVLGLLSIIVSINQSIFAPVAVSSGLLSLLSISALVLALRSRQDRLSRLPPYPYKSEDTIVVVDIQRDDGSLALIRLEEKAISLQDQLGVLYRTLYSDAGALQADAMQCLAPKGAEVVDSFPEAYATIFVISLRRLYHYGRPFDHIIQVAMPDAFKGEDEEYFLFSIGPQTSRLTMRVILPEGKELDPASVVARHGYPGSLSNRGRSVDPSNIGYAPDGRQQVAYTWPSPTQGYTYGLYWGWRPRRKNGP